MRLFVDARGHCRYTADPEVFLTVIARSAATSFSALLAAGLILVGVGAQAQQPKKLPKTNPVSFAKAFVENKGQWNPEALFRSGRPGLDYWITKDGIVLDAYKVVDLSADPYRKGQVVRLRFEGAGGGTPEGADPRPYGMSYFLDKGRAASKVRSFGQAYVRGMAPGVDFKSYFDGSRPRYDLIVKPGSDPSKLAINFEGADSISIGSEGQVVIGTRLGALTQGAIYAYQELDGAKQQVKASYVQISPTRVGIKVGEYDRSQPLVLDPLIYGTHFGGDGGFDEVRDVTVDRDGNLYLTGSTQSAAFPITTGFYGKVALQGTQDAFVTKLIGDSYAISYSVFIGGSLVDTGEFVALDGNGSKLWLAGTTNSTNLPGVDGSSLFATKQGTKDAFLVRFDINAEEGLTPEYVTYYGAASRTLALAGLKVAINTGRPYLAGNVNGTGLPDTDNSFQGGSSDGFLTVLAADGSAIVWSQYVGGSGKDDIGGIAMDTEDALYVGGTVDFTGNQDTAITSPARFETTDGVYEGGRLLRNDDAFVRKYTADGALVFSALLGGSGDDTSPPAPANPAPQPPLDSMTRVAVDNDKNIYVVGVARSFNFPRTRGVFGENFGAGANVTVTKINSNASQILYSTNLQTSGRVYPNSVAVDSRGMVSIGGTVAYDPGMAGSFPGSIVVTSDAIDNTYVGGDRAAPPPAGQFPPTTEGFVSVLSADATELLYGSYVGENSNDFVNRIYVDKADSLWLVGSAQIVFNSNLEPDLPGGLPPGYLSGNALKGENDLSGDGFLVKLRIKLPILTGITVTPNQIPGGLGASSTVTVFVQDPAPAGGLDVVVTSSNKNAASFDQNSQVGSITLNIPEGQTSVSTTVYSFPVQTATPVEIRASFEGDFKATVLTVQPWLTSLTLSGESVVSGNTLTGTVRLFQAAPTGGAVVSLRSSNTNAATVPTTVQVPEGQTFVTFTITAKTVATTELTRITATFLGAVRVQNLRVVPASLSSVTFNPNPVTRGEKTTVRVSLDGVAAGPRTILLSQESGPALVGLPASVFIPKDKRFVEFTVTAPYVVDTVNAIVRATDAGTSQSVTGTLTIDADTDLPDFTITISPKVVVGGSQDSVGTLTLSFPAPQNGLTLTLTSDRPDLTEIPDTLFVPGGQTTVTFDIKTNRTDVPVKVFITAEESSGLSHSAYIWVNPPAVLSTTLNPNVVTGGQNSTATVTLNAPAPPGGVTVDLHASSNVVTIPSSIFIAEGQSSKSFTVKTSAVTQDYVVTIKASAYGTSASGKLTVRAPQLIGLTFNPGTVQGGKPSTGTVTIDQPAPAGGIKVTLTSRNPALVQVPSSVTIPAGKKTATFTATTKPVSRDIAVEVLAQVSGQAAVSAFLFLTR